MLLQTKPELEEVDGELDMRDDEPGDGPGTGPQWADVDHEDAAGAGDSGDDSGHEGGELASEDGASDQATVNVAAEAGQAGAQTAIDPAVAPPPAPLPSSIRDARELAKAAEKKMLAAKGRYKAAKAAFEEATEALFAAIDGYDSPMPLLDNAEQNAEGKADCNTNGQPGPECKADSNTNPAAPVDRATPDSWKAVRLDSIRGLTPGMLKSLAAVEVETLGQLTDYQTTKPLNRVKGFGPATIDKFDDAMEAFWQEHPEYATRT